MAATPPLLDPDRRSNLLTTQNALIDAITSFLTVTVHQVIFLRRIYPPVSFVSTRAFNYPVRQSRHPAVCTWITDAIIMVKDQLQKNALSNLAICIYECDFSRVLERWVVDLHTFPIVERGDSDVPFECVELEMAAEKGKGMEQETTEVPLKRSINREDVEAQFRAILSRLSVSASKLKPLPSGVGAPELSFTVTMELRENADRPVGRLGLLEKGWIAAEPENFDLEDGMETGISQRNLPRRLQGKTVPIRRLEAGELRMEVWIEESRAKFEIISTLRRSENAEQENFYTEEGHDVEEPQIHPKAG